MGTHALQDGAWPESWFEEVHSCPFCLGKSLSPCISGVGDWFFEAVPGEFNFALCEDCHSLVLARRPLPEHLPKAYATYYTHSAGQMRAPSANPIRNLVRHLGARHVRAKHGCRASLLDQLAAPFLLPLPTFRADLAAQSRYLPASQAQVLDYGCGNGDFLARAKALGHTVTGADFDPEACAKAAERGLDVVLTSQIDEAAFAGRFDHITAAHVIEHLPDPRGLLRKFASWLKPGGKVFIEVPHAGAAGLARYGRFWRGLEAPRHFAIPTRKGLEEALADAGLRVAEFGRKSYAPREFAAASQAGWIAHAPDEDPALDVTWAKGDELLICTAVKA